ncbi:hypothetical protein [Halobacillus litoralis]|uniref:hypothetical protein n=1 Tax=Halobacillus litoralis TaxID=45668 RepID=UPI001CD705C3|nr:hypothetical protein [Halobacillus litoralis]MCA1021590.1 hypothetical protein [Halobacillus litoralis]
MNFADFKKDFVDGLELEMSYHKRVINYCLQTMEDVNMFVAECMSVIENVVQAIIKFKLIKQESNGHGGTSADFIFCLNAVREGKSVYEDLLCEYITDYDYKQLTKHHPEKIYAYWTANKASSAMSIYRDLSNPPTAQQDDLGGDLFGSLV